MTAATEIAEVVARVQNRSLAVCENCGGEGYTDMGRSACAECYGAGVTTPEMLAALRSPGLDRDGERMRGAVAPCSEPTAWSDDEHSADPRIEPVAKAIARDGLGVDWEDLPESYAQDFDRNDLRAYAKAAINGLSALPLAHEEKAG